MSKLTQSTQHETGRVTQRLKSLPNKAAVAQAKLSVL